MQLGDVEIDLMSVDFVVVIILFLGFRRLPVASIAMLLLTPKILVETYFKQPHFSKFELGALSVFPGTLVRSDIFMASTFQERYRRNRKLEGFLDLVPTWFSRASKIFVFFSMTYFVLLILTIAGPFIYLWLNDRLV
ncbi:MAG: hypothetical protein COC05_05390 [Gammaproteobacteria bacterium]|nr:MAG: hypothetical protein COC05_05390 [Gammaproteobacteria bacterium]